MVALSERVLWCSRLSSLRAAIDSSWIGIKSSLNASIGRSRVTTFLHSQPGPFASHDAKLKIGLSVSARESIRHIQYWMCIWSGVSAVPSQLVQLQLGEPTMVVSIVGAQPCLVVRIFGNAQSFFQTREIGNCEGGNDTLALD